MERKIFIIIFLLIQLTSCMHQKMFLVRRNISDGRLYLDGYYKLRGKAMFYDSMRNSIAYGIAREQESYNVRIFYTNGISLGGEIIRADSVDGRPEYIYEKYKNKGNSKGNRNLWGIFSLEGDSIKFENWEPSSGGGMKTVIRMGKILNDTTFVITKELNRYDGKIGLRQDTFCFVKLTKKPDSTNIYIK